MVDGWLSNPKERRFYSRTKEVIALMKLKTILEIIILIIKIIEEIIEIVLRHKKNSRPGKD